MRYMYGCPLANSTILISETSPKNVFDLGYQSMNVLINTYHSQKSIEIVLFATEYPVHNYTIQYNILFQIPLLSSNKK